MQIYGKKYGDFLYVSKKSCIFAMFLELQLLFLETSITVFGNFNRIVL